MRQRSIQTDAKRPLFIRKEISAELRKQNFPEKALNRFIFCGTLLPHYVMKECGCGTEFKQIKSRCHNRACPECSKIRRNRIFNKYLPFFLSYKTTRANFFQFLTISPRNFVSLEEGMKKIKKDFRKFLYMPYRTSVNKRGHVIVEQRVKDRIKGGFYVVEAKKTPFGWNVHLHIVYYGSWVDYRLRGKCMECGQNLIKFDKTSKKYYCANRSCNSTHVVCYKDTKLVRIWREVSGDSVHIYGERVSRYAGAVSYLSKYLTDGEKLDNRDLTAFAEYVNVIHNKRTITPFGEFYHKKLPKVIYMCEHCGQRIVFSKEIEAAFLYHLQKSHPPPESNDLSKFEVG